MLNLTTWRVVKRVIAVGAIVALPVTGYAQEATIGGTVTDTTGGVLPGVTVTALHEATGNTFIGVTDDRGAYRLPVRIGPYDITVALQGFATVARKVEVLTGQTAILNFQMSPSAVQESVTVTGEAPLIDTTSSTLGGNVDPRQMQELPVNGRNWTDLALLLPGNRSNAVTETAPVNPVVTFQTDSSFQLNVDGQQVTNLITGGGGFGQPRYSRDAIAEFEFVANRFDATQGRSLGVQVNAITKSGTNTPAGTLSGYFRNDRLNAADLIQHRVLPYSNQQVSVTVGGPIRRDRIHFFGNYEYEREPQTFTYSSPWPRFNVDQSGKRQEHKAGVRVDFQFSPRTRLSVRGNKFSEVQPFDARYSGGANRHPSGALTTQRWMNQTFGDLTHVLGDSTAVNDLKVGFAGFSWITDPVVAWSGAPGRGGLGAPQILLRGYTIGQNYAFSPQTFDQNSWSIRDDFSYSFTKAGRHDMKVGGEYLGNFWQIYFCNNCNGILDATGGAPPANLEDLFPVWNNPGTWNLAALSPIAAQYRIGVGNFGFRNPWHMYAGWAQDDWAVTKRLTLNLGVRYDLAIGQFGERLGIVIKPFFPAGRTADKNNLVPRLGFVFNPNDRTVVRGGFGQYFTQPGNSFVHFVTISGQSVIPPVFNDGRPDFASNPYNGPVPTYEQALTGACDINNSRPGCFRREFRQFTLPDAVTPYTYQTSLGVQQQVGGTMAVSADYVHTAGRHQTFQRNINMSYDPVTGANYPFTDISRRPYPEWGVVGPWVTEGWSNYHALQTAATKRLSQRWQASGTYTLAMFKDGTPQPIDYFQQGCKYPTTPAAGGGFRCDVPVTAPRDLGGAYTLGLSDQRHRATVNGIWDAGYGFQLSGLYLFGSGTRYATEYGGDLRSTGGTGERRLRPDGTIVPRNNFVGDPIHRVDLRIQRGFRLSGRARIDGLLEIYNALNHGNYGAFVTVETARNYGAPSAVQNVSYYARMVQLGFRATF